ncbi:MAG: phosphoribosylformylglycinamidine synthase II, partial [Methanomicrobia archaeon]|nr:phosphoribosylformylglycinamidine synthase II [Methanomicrobia archaeon]
GLSPWEIWVSESQERFLLALKPEQVEEVLAVFEKWDVDAVVLGATGEETGAESPRIRILHNGELIFELETDFLVSCPLYTRPKAVRVKERAALPTLAEPSDYNAILLRLLASPNIASKEAVIRQYDHEVRAVTVIKPLQGSRCSESHGDATVLKPLEHSFRGLAITSDVNPTFCKLNPFWGAASVIDEICRNLTAVGAVPHALADCLNFGNPEKPDRMGDFAECCRGLGYMASALCVPFVSGNVSFYNESVILNEAIPPTPTILGIGICEDVRKCVTVDLKGAGNPLYLIGETRAELGGSEYFKLRGSDAGSVPRTDPAVLQTSMNALQGAMTAGFIASCHDVAEGGLAVTICEMAIGGDLGVSIDIADVTPAIRADFALFSESNSRWMVEVPRLQASRFEAFMNSRNVHVRALGETLMERQLTIRDTARTLVTLPLDNLRKAWRGTIT